MSTKSLFVPFAWVMVLCLGCSQDPGDDLLEVSQSKNKVEVDISATKADMQAFELALKDYKEGALRSSTSLFLQENREEYSREALAILGRASVLYLNSEGITLEDIGATFGSVESPEVIISALILFDHGKKKMQEGEAELRANLLDCLGRATIGVGVAELVSIKALGSVAAKRMALSVVKAAALRAGLGFVGTAIMVGTFVDCMM